MSRAKYDRNNVTFGPDRSDLEYKLDRIEETAADFKTDLEPVVGIVEAYDPITRIIDVIVDPTLPSIPVENGSGVYPNPGDTMIIQPIAGEYYATGIVQEVQFPDHELINYIIPSGVAGTPRTPPTELYGTSSNRLLSYMINGPDWVAYMINSTQLLKVNMDGTSNVLSLSSALTNIYTDGVTAAATNRVNTIQHLDALGVTTTVSYSGTLTKISAAGYDGTDYCFVGTSITVTKVIRVNGATGAHTVTDISATFAAHYSTNVVTRAGSGYFCIWTDTPGTGMWVNGTIYASIGTATGINGDGHRYHSTGSGFGNNSALREMDIEGGYLYWSFSTTGYYEMDLSTGGLTLYNNIYPTNPSLFPSVGAIGSGVIVLASDIVKSGGGYRPAFWLSDGSTTTEILTTGTESTDVYTHEATASGDGSVGYVYYFLSNGLQDYIVGASI